MMNNSEEIMIPMMIIPLLLITAPTLAKAQSFTKDLAERGYAEGYSHWPMSFPQNKEYVFNYKLGVQDYKMTLKDKNWTFLSALPAHSSDNYKDFYLGEKAGGDAYNSQQGNGKIYGNDTCPSGHSAEFCKGYKFGFNIPSNNDAS